MSRQRNYWAIVLVIGLFCGLLMLANLSPIEAAIPMYGGTQSSLQDGMCPVWDTGFVQTIDDASQTISWSLASRPIGVTIHVCTNSVGSNCTLAATGVGLWDGTSGYGLDVRSISASGIILRLNPNGIAAIDGIGWLMRGSAYVRVIAYQYCDKDAIDPYGHQHPSATANATIPALVTKVSTLPPLVTAVATLSTPAPTDTPNATIEALVTAIAAFTNTGTITPTSTVTPSYNIYLPIVVTDTLTSGNEWMFVRSLTAGEVTIGVALLCLLAIGAFKLVTSL